MEIWTSMEILYNYNWHRPEVIMDLVCGYRKISITSEPFIRFSFLKNLSKKSENKYTGNCAVTEPSPQQSQFK